MAFFSLISLTFLMVGLFFGAEVIIDYYEKGRIVTKIPSAILSTLLILISMISFIGGFTVSAINRRFDELTELLKKK